MNHEWESFAKSITDIVTSSGNKTLVCSPEVSFSGFDCLNYFKTIANQLDEICPKYSRVVISLTEGPLQAIAILSTLYAKRVPVILANSELVSQQKKSEKISIGAIIQKGEKSQIEVSAVQGFQSRSFPQCGLVLFTSGSTGQPKAVNIPLKGLTRNYQWIKNYFSLTDNEKAAVTLPISHTLALNTQFIPNFLAGGITFFISSKEQFGRQYEMIVANKCTFVTSIAEILRLWEKEKKVRNLPPALSVKNIQLAGGHISADHLKMAQSLFPEAVVHKGYGMTETIRTSMISSEDKHFSSSTCGYILGHQDVKICDSDGQELQSGEHGEIYVKSETCHLGYDDDVLTSSRQDDYFATGDLGFLLDNHLLFCIGRKDQIFKVKGKKISGFELEKVALEIENIEAAKCAAVFHSRKGMCPIMFLESQGQSESELIESANNFEKKMRNKLSLAKVPRDVVILSKFPRSQNYKIRISELEKIWERKEGLQILPSASLLIRFYRG